MNQEKIGNLIATLRKKKNLTQEQLGEKLGITGKSVSKWERGINAPDISLLKPLSEILNTSVVELLEGELKENITKETINNIDNSMINTMSMYEKNNQKKYKKYIYLILSFLIIVTISLTSLYIINNHNKVKMYNINSTNNVIALNGYIIFNPNQQYIILDKIEYNDIYEGTDKSKEALAVKISLITNDKVIIEYGSLDSENYKLQKLNDYLSNTYIKIKDNSKDSIVKENELNELYLNIEYVNKQEKIEILKYKLNIVKEFENNKIIYN